MKMGINYIFLLVVIFSSCNQKKILKPEKWLQEIENESNSYRKTIVTGDLIYTFQYKPHEYIAMKEVSSLDILKLTLAERKRKLAKTVWFNIYIKSKHDNINPLKRNASGNGEYEQRLNYFLVNAEKNFSLKYNGVEMQMASYFFENNYGLTPSDAMIIGFYIPDEIPSKELILEYEDKLYDNGILKIKLTTDDLLNIPTLNF